MGNDALALDRFVSMRNNINPCHKQSSEQTSSRKPKVTTHNDLNMV